MEQGIRIRTVILIWLLLSGVKVMYAQSCLPEGITFTTQSQIDSFQINYPGCAEILGDVKISGNDITSLGGLNVLISLGENFWIENNDSLINLTGLENLSYINGNLYVFGNDALLSLSGLDGLSTLEGHLFIGLDYYSGNQLLYNLAGLENLSYIGGRLSFCDNPALNNITALEGIKTINYDLEIRSNASLTSLSGLNNIKTIGGKLNIIDNPSLTNMVGLDSLSNIGDKLVIDYNDGILNLTGLDNLNYIGGHLHINHNHSLVSLTGLEGLNEINGNLTIGWLGGNSSLINIEGLENLTSIDGRLWIQNNSVLNSLSGLNNIDEGSITDLYIFDNDSLSECEVQSICNYLVSPNGSVNIFGNAHGCESPSEVADACGILLQCFPYGNYYFTSQSQIDSFQINYPNCTDLLGYVQIFGDDITSLYGLNEVSSIGKGFYIQDNPVLTSLAGLEGLDSIGDYLILYENNVLTDLRSLENLQLIGGQLRIWYNDALGSLDGLDNIEASSIEGLKIEYNPLLSECEVLSICNYLNNPNGNTFIDGNTVGCNSVEEVLDSCNANAVFVEEPYLISGFSVFPNPFTTSTTIEYELKEISNIQFTIYNVIGEVVYMTDDRMMPQGKHAFTWTADCLPEGLYYAVLRSEEGVAVVKMVKQR